MIWAMQKNMGQNPPKAEFFLNSNFEILGKNDNLVKFQFGVVIFESMSSFNAFS